MKPPNATSSKSSVTTRAARHRHERLSTNVRGQVTYRFTQPFRHGSAAPSALSITRNHPVSSDDSSNPLTEITASLNIVRPSYADDLYATLEDRYALATSDELHMGIHRA